VSKRAASSLRPEISICLSSETPVKSLPSSLACKYHKPMTLHIRLSRRINSIFSLYDGMRATPTLLSSGPITPKLDFFTAVLERLHHGSHEWLKRSQNPCFAALDATKHGHSRALQLFSRQSQRRYSRTFAGEVTKYHSFGGCARLYSRSSYLWRKGLPKGLPMRSHHE
jgi:hypothetical protein